MRKDGKGGGEAGRKTTSAQFGFYRKSRLHFSPKMDNYLPININAQYQSEDPLVGEWVFQNRGVYWQASPSLPSFICPHPSFNAANNRKNYFFYLLSPRIPCTIRNGPLFSRKGEGGGRMKNFPLQTIFFI